jgi:hypothetical protein
MPFGLLLATNVIYVSLVLISLVEKDDRVGFCFIIDYVSGITHIPTSLNVGPTPCLIHANNFDACTLILLMWSYRFLATVYASHTTEMFSLVGGDDYYCDNGNGDNSVSSLKAFWLELNESVSEVFCFLHLQVETAGPNDISVGMYVTSHLIIQQFS